MDWKNAQKTYRLKGDINILKKWRNKQSKLCKNASKFIDERIEEGEVDDYVGISPVVLFDFIHQRMPNCEKDYIICLSYRALFNIPRPFLKNALTLIAFHEWMEHGFPYAESKTKYLWKVIIRNKRRTVSLDKKYFIKYKLGWLNLKNHVFLQWINVQKNKK